MYHSLSAPRQTAWEWQTFIKTLHGRGGRIKGLHGQLFSSLRLRPIPILILVLSKC